MAHHVSAMVIQAQAGRVVAAVGPGSGARCARDHRGRRPRTLAEMRAMVGALRDRDRRRPRPADGIADIERLARGPDDGRGRR